MLKDFRIRAAIVLLALAGQSSGASTFSPTVLNSFGGGNGSTPQAGLVEGSDSNFYGTTFTGGASNTGAVFKISPAGTLTALHHFSGADGANPAAGLVEGSDGNFYGTTLSGGTGNTGTVFQISPAGSLTTLHNFSGVDGARPQAGLVEGTDGNFYGTTLSGGTSNTGTVFQITSVGALTTLHQFSGADGANPTAGLVEGSDGNFYGTTFNGGTNDDGTVFQISSAGTLTMLYEFSGKTNGANPQAGLIQGSDGNFYGTTLNGGTHNNGTVFKINSSGALTTLYQFSGGEGANLRGGLVEGNDGFFYGMATGGGSGFGTVFRIDSNGVLTRLYSFAGGTDGAFPYAGLILGGDGNLYGTTAFGGQNLHGVVFRIKAVPAGTYSGLVIETNAPSHASSGFISLILDDTGSFTARLTMGGVRSTFKGQFDASNNATNTIPRKNLNTLQTVLQLNSVGGTNQIAGTVSDGVFTSELLADLAGVFSTRTNFCPWTGQYTFVLAPADTNDTSVPQGYGYSTLTVAKTGSGKLQGVLGDGTKIKATVPVSAIGTWPLYGALYKNRGSCLGWITLSTNSAMDTVVDWFKPPVAKDSFYPAGFTTSLVSTGALYVSPTNGVSSIVGSGTLTFGGGNLTSNIVKSLVISSNGTIVVSPPGNDNLALQITLKTGQFSGSFRETTINKTVKFSGLLLQIDNSGAGYFLGTNQSGFATIELIP